MYRINRKIAGIFILILTLLVSFLTEQKEIDLKHRKKTKRYIKHLPNEAKYQLKSSKRIIDRANTDLMPKRKVEFGDARKLLAEVEDTVKHIYYYDHGEYFKHHKMIKRPDPYSDEKGLEEITIYRQDGQKVLTFRDTVIYDDITSPYYEVSSSGTVVKIDRNRNLRIYSGDYSEEVQVILFDENWSDMRHINVAFSENGEYISVYSVDRYAFYPPFPPTKITFLDKNGSVLWQKIIEETGPRDIFVSPSGEYIWVVFSEWDKKRGIAKNIITYVFDNNGNILYQYNEWAMSAHMDYSQSEKYVAFTTHGGGKFYVAEAASGEILFDIYPAASEGRGVYAIDISENLKQVALLLGVITYRFKPQGTVEDLKAEVVVIDFDTGVKLWSSPISELNWKPKDHFVFNQTALEFAEDGSNIKLRIGPQVFEYEIVQ